MYSIFEQLLNKYHLKAVQVSKETGIPQSTFSDWKKGKSSPKIEKLKLIAEYFGVSVDFLMGNTDKIYCYSCGTWFNPFDTDSDSNHSVIHEKWEKAVQKYGFCYSYIASDERSLYSKQILKRNDITAIDQVHFFEELLKAEFSDLLRENNYEYLYDFKTFVSKKLYKNTYKEMISEDAFELLKNKYGINTEIEPVLKENSDNNNDNIAFDLPENIRAVARDLMDLPEENRKLAIDMIKMMSQRGKDAKKK